MMAEGKVLLFARSPLASSLPKNRLRPVLVIRLT